MERVSKRINVDAATDMVYCICIFGRSRVALSGRRICLVQNWDAGGGSITMKKCWKTATPRAPLATAEDKGILHLVNRLQRLHGINVCVVWTYFT